jgi:hypothetical protein
MDVVGNLELLTIFDCRSDLIGQGWKREGWQTDREGGGYKHGQVIGFHEV